MINSACMSHVCNRKESLANIYEADPTILVGNKVQISVKLIASVRVKTVIKYVTYNMVLKGVLYAPKMMSDFISRSQSRQKGFKATTNDNDDNPTSGLMQLTHKESNNVCILGWKVAEGLYEAILTVRTTCTAILSASSAPQLWQRRGGRAGDGTVRRSLVHVEGLPSPQLHKRNNYNPSRFGKTTKVLVNCRIGKILWRKIQCSGFSSM